MAGEAPKPLSAELDGPIAHAVSGKISKTTRRLNRRIFSLGDRLWGCCSKLCSKKPAYQVAGRGIGQFPGSMRGIRFP
jgi:hypothetical protein